MGPASRIDAPNTPFVILRARQGPKDPFRRRVATFLSFIGGNLRTGFDDNKKSPGMTPGLSHRERSGLQ
jgi:hypothetical protein